MARAKRDEPTDEVEVRYVGDGEFILGVPSDPDVVLTVSAEEAERLTATGLYERVGEQEDKPE